MKMKMIIAALFVLVAGAARAQQAVVVKAGEINRLSVAPNMNIVLVPHTGRQFMEASNFAMSQLTLQFQANELSIDFAPGAAKDQIVYVLTGALTEIRLGENSTLETQGILSSKDIKVYVAAGATARLLTNGKVVGYAVDDSEVKIAQNATPDPAKTF